MKICYQRWSKKPRRWYNNAEDSARLGAIREALEHSDMVNHKPGDTTISRVKFTKGKQEYCWIFHRSHPSLQENWSGYQVHILNPVTATIYNMCVTNKGRVTKCTKYRGNYPEDAVPCSFKEVDAMLDKAIQDFLQEKYAKPAGKSND